MTKDEAVEISKDLVEQIGRSGGGLEGVGRYEDDNTRIADRLDMIIVLLSQLVEAAGGRREP